MSKKRCPKCQNYMMLNHLTGKPECHHCGYNRNKKARSGSTCESCKYLKPIHDNEYLYCEKHGEIRKTEDKSCVCYA